MGKFAVGEVIVVSFPFSDLKGQKSRPALVVAEAEFGNVILCQITSKPYSSQIAIKLTQNDFKQGGLPIVSYIRPDKLFTAESSIIHKSYGKLSIEKKHGVLETVRKLFSD